MYDATILIEHLKRLGILFRVDEHPPTRKAAETARTEGVPPGNFAKVVLLLGGRARVLAVLRADTRIDLPRLRELTGYPELRLATEEELGKEFPHCEVGAMPPLGNPGEFEIHVEDDLARAPEITFHACSRRHTITIGGEDFLRACGGHLLDFDRDEREEVSHDS